MAWMAVPRHSTLWGGAEGTAHSRVPLNINRDGCAFAIRTGYERHAYLNGMTRGGGFYPATGVLEIYEDHRDGERHIARDLQSDEPDGGKGVQR